MHRFRELIGNPQDARELLGVPGVFGERATGQIAELSAGSGAKQVRSAIDHMDRLAFGEISKGHYLDTIN